MSDFDSGLPDMPGHLVRRFQQIALALFLDQAKSFDFTPVQYAALVAIGNQPGLDQTALCNAIALDRSTVGDVVGRLERKGLIRRVSGSADRRTKSLHITASGRRLIQDIAPAVRETQRLILAPLKPNERSSFMQMLKRLVHLNNEHSRAPLRPSELRSGEPRPKPARETPSTARARPQWRPRAARRAPR